MIRRLLRRWARGVRRHPVRVWHHPAFRVPLAPQGAPLLDPRRGDNALTWALDEGVIGPDDVALAPEVSWTDAGRVHGEAYLERLDEPSVVSNILAVSEDVLPLEGVLELWRRGCGGVVEALRWSLTSESPAVCLAGGFHHAAPHRGGGFCALNDIAIAIAVARADGLTGRVLVLDFDAHPPDGTVDCVKQDEATWVHSLSVASDWSIPPGPRLLDARVPAGTTDDAYLAAVDDVLAQTPKALVAVLYLAGNDPLEGDPLGGLSVSEAALLERDRRVFRRFRGLPIVAVPAGGYTDRAWRVLAGTIATAAELDVTVAQSYDPLARRTQYTARHIDPSLLTGLDDDFAITEADVLGDMRMGMPKEQRFLDYYTRHGMEHALTAHGFFGALEAMGFADLKLVFEYTESSHRLRVTSPVRGKREDLVDLCLSKRTMGNFQVLFVEWLEMRDPRVSFAADRPKLPGQRAPGLGLAPEVGHLLVVSAQRLGLDGVGLVPAHFHVAWMARHRFTPVLPKDRGHFRAIVKHLEHVPLRTATRLLGEAGLGTEDGDVVRWWSPEMAIPTGDAMTKWLKETEPQARVAEESMAQRLLPVLS